MMWLMKKIAFPVSLLVSLHVSPQPGPRKIDIRLGNYRCAWRDDLKPDAGNAFKLMSMVYSSKDFQDSLAKLTFPSNACNACGIASSLKGDAILDILFSKPTDTWGLILKKHSGAMGKTTPQESFTKAFYYNIAGDKGDMCNLPFAIGLAVNLCHEYMHHICFCHPKSPDDVFYRKPPNGNHCEDENFDPVNYETDVAYRVGWIAYDILLRWYNEKKLQGYF
jgi:hypothetical protein